MTAWMLLAAASLNALAWLAGSWELRERHGCTVGYWTRPSTGTLLRMRSAGESGKTRSSAFVRTEARAAGIYYVAQPGGRPPVDFKLSGDPGSELTFVNPGTSDHLKKIIYRRNGEDGMAARIEGENNGKPFAVDYVYRRAPSNAASRCGEVK